MKGAKILIFLAIVSTLIKEGAEFSSAATKFDPSLKWQVIKSQNFSIYFYQGEEEIAQECADIAEDVHKKLQTFLAWSPKEKVSIVVADNDDRANAFAILFPHNTIYVTLTTLPPIVIGSRFSNWLKFVIIHEYTHIIHLDMVKGFPGFIRTVFGRVPYVSFPNQLQPLWLIEGLAAYEETNLTEGGRGKEPLFDMILRMAFLEGQLNSLDQISSSSLQTFPDGIVSYLYGVSICQYIANRYGEDKLKEIAHNYSNSFPYLFVFGALPGGGHITMNVNTAIRKAIGINATQLFREWKQYLNKYYSKYSSKAKEGKSQELTRKGYFIFNPTWSPEGKYIAYFEDNKESYPSLRIISRDGAIDKKMIECKFVSEGFSFSPQGNEIVYAELICHNNFSNYSYLFTYNLNSKKKRELLTTLRAKDPCFSPNGKKILFVTNERGYSNLAIIDMADLNITYLTEHKDRIQYYTPTFSPDGSKIAFSRWKDGFQDICIADQEGQNITPIIEDKSMDIHPSWSPDGKYILFSSDRNGIFNLYAFSIKDKKLYQITNVVGGSFDPAISPDGEKIAFVSYSSKGYDIHLMDVNTTDWKEVSLETTQVETKSFIPQKAFSNYQVHPYKPLPSLSPKFWIPLISIDQITYSNGKKSKTSLSGLGFATHSKDVLNKHSFDLFSIYDINNKKLRFSLTYNNDQLYPTIGIGLKEDGINWASITLPINRIRSRQSLSILAFHGGFESRWDYTNIQKYGFSISPTDGRSTSLTYKKETKSFGSSLDNNELIVDWKEYIRLPLRNQVLGLRLAGGGGDGLIYLGGELGTEDIVMGETSFPLRGYEYNSFCGKKVLVSSIEYRFPMKNIEQGWSVFPVFFDRMHGAIFVDCGKVWRELQGWKGVKLGGGVELRLDTHLLYSTPWTIRVGVAYGFNKGGETRSYVGGGLSF